MKKLLLVTVSIMLAGCATLQQPVKRPQQNVVHVAHKAKPASAPVVSAPVAVPMPAPVATKLTKPRWYDRFRARFKKGN